ncbi:hypothetical protein NGM10_02185 [Halorussus salilacus]|uniref:hypothetical protein n=1 Tax=Halorussus salilacus TaxID=2953750 RepID=UPI00209CDAC5|nr:hypothetical protein [Halorussus salilacus]USZ68560.1 hypothetical protein NGM10_02185 [Halorussus salilacus]
MTRVLKTSGFLGLAAMMVVGLYQNVLLASGQAAPAWMIGGHAHLGVLSILAIVMGFAVDALGVVGRIRSAVTGLYVVGQWFLPLTVWLAGGFGLGFLHPTAFVWGLCLIVAMLLMAYRTATASADAGGQARASALADD